MDVISEGADESMDVPTTGAEQENEETSTTKSQEEDIVNLKEMIDKARKNIPKPPPSSSTQEVKSDSTKEKIAVDVNVEKQEAETPASSQSSYKTAESGGFSQESILEDEKLT